MLAVQDRHQARTSTVPSSSTSTVTTVPGSSGTASVKPPERTIEPGSSRSPRSASWSTSHATACAGCPSAAAPDAVALLAPGGLLLKDDLTPNWPGPDPVRELLFGHPELVAVEILTTPETAAVVAARR